MNQEQQIAYLAGLVDGDGCLALYRRKDIKAARGFTFSPYMTITAKNRWFLELLADIYGGRVNVHTVKSGFSKDSETSSIRFSSNVIRELLPRMIPHLILKKREALLLMEALDITKHHKKRDKSLDVRLEEITMEMKSIKKDRVQ